MHEYRLMVIFCGYMQCFGASQNHIIKNLFIIIFILLWIKMLNNTYNVSISPLFNNIYNSRKGFCRDLCSFHEFNKMRKMYAILSTID